MWSRWQSQLDFTGTSCDPGRDADHLPPQPCHGAPATPIAMAKPNSYLESVYPHTQRRVRELLLARRICCGRFIWGGYVTERDGWDQSHRAVPGAAAQLSWGDVVTQRQLARSTFSSRRVRKRSIWGNKGKIQLSPDKNSA